MGTKFKDGTMAGYMWVLVSKGWCEVRSKALFGVLTFILLPSCPIGSGIPNITSQGGSRWTLTWYWKCLWEVMILKFLSQRRLSHTLTVEWGQMCTIGLCGRCHDEFISKMGTASWSFLIVRGVGLYVRSWCSYRVVCTETVTYSSQAKWERERPSLFVTCHIFNKHLYFDSFNELWSMELHWANWASTIRRVRRHESNHFRTAQSKGENGRHAHMYKLQENDKHEWLGRAWANLSFANWMITHSLLWNHPVQNPPR